MVHKPPVLHIKGLHIPITAIYGLFGTLIASNYLFNKLASFQSARLTRLALESTENVPLWDSVTNAVNLDRQYFELTNDAHNVPDLFYHGLYIIKIIVEQLKQDWKWFPLWYRTQQENITDPTSQSNKMLTDIIDYIKSN